MLNTLQESTTLLKVKKPTRVNSLRTFLRVLANCNSRTEEDMKVCSGAARNMVKARCCSPTETSTQANGTTTYSTVRESSSRKLTAQSVKGLGKRASGLLG